MFFLQSVADLYIVLFDKIHADPEGTPNGREGYYFGVNGEHYMYDVYKKIAEVLVKRGLGKSPEPTPFAEEDLDRYLGVRFSFSMSKFQITVLMTDTVPVYWFELSLQARAGVCHRLEAKRYDGGFLSIDRTRGGRIDKAGWKEERDVTRRLGFASYLGGKSTQ